MLIPLQDSYGKAIREKRSYKGIKLKDRLDRALAYDADTGSTPPEMLV